MFLFPADGVHKALIIKGSIIGRIYPVKWLFKALWAYQNPKMLAQTINEVYFINPVGLSAGFDKNFQLLGVLPYLGFGFGEHGSLTFESSPGNPRPHYRRLKKSQSILVNAGLNNQGSKELIDRIKAFKPNKKYFIPLDISVAKTNSNKTTTDETGIKDYISSLKAIKKAGAGDQITINISCPNAYGGEPFTSPGRLKKLLREVDKLKIDLPVYLKMPSDLAWSDFKKLLDVAIRHNIAGLKISNLAKDRDLVNMLDDLGYDIPGNMSGKPVYELSNDLINKTYAYCGDKMVIVGIGGIFNADDAYEKIKHGASLIELITGMIFEGPELIGQINAGLVDLMRKDGYTRISQAVGAYHKNRC
jgi:dihydroorotate dehydrogenase (fumarate)